MQYSAFPCTPQVISVGSTWTGKILLFYEIEMEIIFSFQQQTKDPFQRWVYKYKGFSSNLPAQENLLQRSWREAYIASALSGHPRQDWSVEDEDVANRGERIVFWWPNTNIIQFPKNCRIRIQVIFGFPRPSMNTNIIRFPKNDWIRIQILFGVPKWPNTNTNIIRFPKNDRIRIRILFGFPKMTEYEYEYYSTL